MEAKDIDVRLREQAVAISGERQYQTTTEQHEMTRGRISLR